MTARQYEFSLAMGGRMLAPDMGVTEGFARKIPDWFASFTETVVTSLSVCEFQQK
jgi:hypothetical protein